MKRRNYYKPVFNYTLYNPYDTLIKQSSISYVGMEFYKQTKSTILLTVF